MKIEFFVTERENRFCNKGKEHALFCQIGDDYPFCIAEYETAPTKQEVSRAKKIAHRSMEFYHRSIKWPKFEIEDVD